jgi:hypothetical protein
MESFVNKVVEFNQFEHELAEFKERHENTIYDLSDQKQNKMARSDKYSIGKVISALDKAHAAVKAPLLNECRLIDNARNNIKDQLKGIQNRIKEQIQSHEAFEAERIDAHKNEMAYISGQPFADTTWMDCSLNDVKLFVSELEELVIDHSWDEFKDEAIEARRCSIETSHAQ